MFRILILYQIFFIVNFSVSYAIETPMTSNFSSNKSIKKVPTIEEFNKIIEENDFLKENNANQKMELFEEGFIKNALKYEHSAGGGTIIRPLSKFKGNTLVVGGGNKLGETSVIEINRARGRTDLTRLNIDLKNLEKDIPTDTYGSNKFYKVNENYKKIQLKLKKKSINLN